MIINMQAKRLWYKRKSDESDYEQGSDGDVDVVKESDITDEELIGKVRTSYNIICENGTGDDFLAVLDSSSNKTLPVGNITLQLLL